VKFSSYSSYKSTGVDWVPEVPSHWNFQSVKSILVERIEKNDPIKTKDILSLTMDRGVIPYSERGGGGNKAKEDIRSYKLAYPNDIVLNSMNVVAGAVGLSKYFGAVSPVYYMLYARNSNFYINYYDKIFSSTEFQKSLLGLGNGILMKETEGSGKLNTIRMKIPIDKLNIQYLPIPPLDEQKNIAIFLERENAKIDALVEKQEILINLLTENYQTVVSLAISNGLKAVKNKSAAILESLPDGWSSKQLRRIVLNHKQGYYTTQGYIENGGLRLLRITDLMEGGRINYDECPLVEDIPEASDFLLEKGDFVFARTGGAGSFGLVSEIPPPTVFASYLIRFKFAPEVHTTFLKYYFLSDNFKNGIDMNIHGGVNKNVHAEDIKNQFIRIPPKSEQLEIVEYLDAFTKQNQALIIKSKKSIELLKEHRASLIYSAVTGKIDVRHLVN
jgi:type I restriction enzyme S subunit